MLLQCFIAAPETTGCFQPDDRIGCGELRSTEQGNTVQDFNADGEMDNILTCESGEIECDDTSLGTKGRVVYYRLFVLIQ